MENTGGGGGEGVLMHGGSEDVLIQILVCLPIKSLLRFKSVSKSWGALIDSPFFIDLHTTTFNSSSSSSNKFGSFILQAIEFSACGLELKMFMLSSESGEDKVVFSPFYKEDSLLTGSIKMVGSCNGLICLHDSNLRDVSLWNPATRHFRILPKSITIQVQGVSKEDFFDDFIAFGFDVKTKDYKVVWITPFMDGPMEEGCMCRVQVYSLSTDSWRLLEGINYLPVVPTQLGSFDSFLNQGIYLNGSHLFMGRRGHLCNNSLMMSFDFTKEIFTTMQLPDHDVRHRMVLSNMGDKLVVSITRGDHDYDFEFCEIWVLNDHDSGGVNKESWTKLHSYQIKNNGASRCYRPAPLCISNKGEFALWTINDGSNKLQLFNLVTKEAQKVFTIDNGVSRADVYKQSLVSIIGGNGAEAAAASR